MLVTPVTSATRFVLVRPHYPENVGAAARAIKTMGITRLSLVKPGRLAQPEHEMAFKMAVRAWDVLEQAQVTATLSEALAEADIVYGTTARRGQKGLFTARAAAKHAAEQARRGKRIVVVFGNEKTGLDSSELRLCPYRVRIPMAADQPSINLAQSCQLIAYEWFMAGLDARRGDPPQREPTAHATDHEAPGDPNPSRTSERPRPPDEHRWTARQPNEQSSGDE